MEIAGRGVLVTGGSRGLGAALGRALAREGARVVLVARGRGRSRAVVADIRRDGGEAHGLAADVGAKEDIHRIAGAAAALVGPLDVLVHNASTLGPTPLRPLLDTECEDLARVLEVNLVGPFRLTKAVAGRHGAARARPGRARHVGRVGRGLPALGRLRRVEGRARPPGPDLGRGAGGHRRALPDRRSRARWTPRCTRRPCRRPTARRSPIRRRWRTASWTSSATRSRSRAARASRRRRGARRLGQRVMIPRRRPRPRATAACCISIRARARAATCTCATCRGCSARRPGGGQRRRHAARVVRRAHRRRQGAGGAAGGRERGRDVDRGALRRRRLAAAHGGPAGAARAGRRTRTSPSAPAWPRASSRCPRLSPRLVTLAFAATGSTLWSALYRLGRPVQYSYLRAPLALWDVQTFFASRPWAVEPPSAGPRPHRGGHGGAARRRRRGGDASPTPRACPRPAIPPSTRALPLPERYEFPTPTVAAVRDRARRAAARDRHRDHGGARAGRRRGGWRTAARAHGMDGHPHRRRHRPRVVDALLTGLHEPGETHFELLRAFAPDASLAARVAHAGERGYLTHEFGDAMIVI